MTALAIPSTSSSLTVPITSFTATDNVGVTGYALTESATAPAAAATVWSAAPPTSYTFDSAGAKTLYGWAKDSAGNTGSLSATVLIVLPDTTAPTVSITAPAAGATLSGTTTVSVTATDAVGVTRVELFLDGALAGTDTAAPFSFSWDTRTASSGAHTVTASAYDAAGNVGQSTSVSVTVANPTTTIALVQSRSVDGTGVRSLARTFSGPNTAGNLLIAFVRMATTSQTVTISDSAGNTYVQAAAQVQNSDGSQVRIFYASNARAGTNRVTATFSGRNSQAWLAIFEYRGVSALDRIGVAQGYSSSPSCPVLVSTTSPELLFAGIGLRSSSSARVTAGAGYTLGQQHAVRYGPRAATEYRVSSSSGSYAGGFTLSSSTYWSCVSASFRL